MSTTTYNVVATRSGRWWAIEVTSGLPDNVLGVSQARRLTEVEKVARELIVDLVGGDTDEVDVVVETKLPEELEPMLALFREATSIETVARSVVAHARSLAAELLLDADLTVREAGLLLGVSHQRVKQLADRAHESDYNPDAVLHRMTNLVRALTAGVHEEHEDRPGPVFWLEGGHLEHDDPDPMIGAWETYSGSLKPIPAEDDREAEDHRVADSSRPG